MCTSGYNSNLIGWHPNFAGNGPPGKCTRELLTAKGMFPSLSFILEFPMPLASSGRPSATGAPFLVVESMQMPFGRHVGWCPRGLGKTEVAVTVEQEALVDTPFLLVIHLHG